MGKKVSNPMARADSSDEASAKTGKKAKSTAASVAEAVDNPADQASNLVLGLATCGVFFFILVAVNVSVMAAMSGSDSDSDDAPVMGAGSPTSTDQVNGGAMNGIGAGSSRSEAAASVAATQQTFIATVSTTYQSDDPGAASTYGITAATQACMAAGTCTNEFFALSQLIGAGYGLAINEWIASRYDTSLDQNIAANQHWRMCFSTNDHPYAHPQEFHDRCDMYAKTVTVARNQIGYLFGGYADKSWSRCPGAQNCYGGYDTTATRNFIFGLSQTFQNGTIHSQPTMHGPHGANDHFQADSRNIWPTWGRGADLSLGMLGPPGVEAYCDQLGPGGAGHTYGAVRKETCGGALSTWGHTDVEVWYRDDEVAAGR